MSRLPTVAIIGRPNTGKSTLFNAIVGKRLAIVSDIPGTTRDRVATKVTLPRVDFLLIDTAGMGGGSDDTELEDDVAQQSMLALANADIIVLTFDSRNDLTSSDHRVIDVLRKNRKRHVPVIIALTKVDTPTNEETLIGPYFALGITDDIVSTSGAHRRGTAELIDLVEERLLSLHFSKDIDTPFHDAPPRIAVIGKPNVGKSSIINALMSDPDRISSGRLVTPIAGTTRDTSDTIVRFQKKEYVLIDTAGLRKQTQREKEIENYASMRSIRAIYDADVTVLVLDALEPFGRQEKRIASMAIEAGTGLIFVLNKIDLLTSEEKKAKMVEIRSNFLFCLYAPILPCSALSKEGLLTLFPTIDSVSTNRRRRIPTRDLHRWFDQVSARTPLGAVGTAKHITQAEDVPPTFVLFLSSPKDVKVSQLRTLDNSIRTTFAFEGTPIRWITKSKHRASS